MRGADAEKLLRSIAANIRRLRTKRKLTQEQLAELADVDLRFVQKLEAGNVNPSATTLATFSKSLGVTVLALFRHAELEPVRIGRPARRPSPKPKSASTP